MAGENTFHRNLGITDGIHLPYSWEYADTATREGASGFLVADEGKFARQLDNDSVWMLTDYAAPAWMQINSGSDVLVKISSNDTTANYLSNKLLVDAGSNSSNILEISEVNDGSDEDLKIQIDPGKIAHSDINDDEASKHRTINDSGSEVTDLWSANKIGTELGGKSNTGHSHVENDITDLDHTDINAIHDNVANEVSALSEKTSINDNDLVIIEDSEASYVKKKVKASNLPGQGSFKEYHFDAISLYTPCNSDWPAGNIHAELNLDTEDPALFVRKFGDGANDGIGFLIEVPTGATNIVFNIKNRAQTAPGTEKAVMLKLYFRQIVDGSAVPSWSAGLNLSAISIPTNAYWKNNNESISLSTLGVTAGRVVQFELTRDYNHASDTLVGYWLLLHMKISFT